MQGECGFCFSVYPVRQRDPDELAKAYPDMVGRAKQERVELTDLIEAVFGPWETYLMEEHPPQAPQCPGSSTVPFRLRMEK